MTKEMVLQQTIEYVKKLESEVNHLKRKAPALVPLGGVTDEEIGVAFKVILSKARLASLEFKDSAGYRLEWLMMAGFSL